MTEQPRYTIRPWHSGYFALLDTWYDDYVRESYGTVMIFWTGADAHAEAERRIALRMR